ncbi:MAG: tetraacyldisaccharide 4'-kinase [bacterium]
MPDEVILLVERFKSKKFRIPVIVSKNRLSAAEICSNNDDIYYNLAESITIAGQAENHSGHSGLPSEEINISGTCLYKDVHGEYENNKKIAILDDGFSALNIKKNLNIVLIDNTLNVFGQNVIPAGILREPLSVLKYADVIVINKCDKEILKNSLNLGIEEKIRKYNALCPLFYSYYEPAGISNDNENGERSLAIGGLKNKRAVTVCAIGNPGYFYDNLIGCGVVIDRKIEFEDHHDYSEKDMENIKDILDAGEDYLVITTLKDYVKLKRFRGEENYKDMFNKIYYLDFELVIDKSFFEFIYYNYGNYKKYSEKK